jgi:5-deoxy-D-glucuronate isomerase
LEVPEQVNALVAFCAPDVSAALIREDESGDLVCEVLHDDGNITVWLAHEHDDGAWSLRQA